MGVSLHTLPSSQNIESSLKNGSCIKGKGIKACRQNSKLLIKLRQLEGYSNESKLLQSQVDKGSYINIMLQLGLFLENGLTKCKGGIHMVNWPHNDRYPILLPSSHHVTKLLIQTWHDIDNHYGTNYNMP